MDLQAVVTPPQIPQSEEPTRDQPIEGKNDDQQQSTNVEAQDRDDELLEKYGKKLLELIAKKRASWEWKRRGIVQKALKNKEMLKGNQAIGFFPGTTDTFDALEQYYNFTGSDTSGKNGDESMDRRPHNFYQMCENAFEAALSAQVPKNRWLPENPDVLEDRETSKAASTVETIIERYNKIRSMLKQELMEIFTGGAYFKHTRYVVDAERTGTHRETVLQIMAADVLPARFVCFQCGTTTPEEQVAQSQQMSCPECGAPLQDENYFESHVDQVPVAEEKSDVPNGMVLQDIYSVLQVDADPDAANLLGTPLLNVSCEVSLGWLKTTFEKYWDKFSEGMTTGSGSDMLERQYRDMVTTPAGYSVWSTGSNQTKPTYSRCWCNPELYAELEDKNLYQSLKKDFPNGVMIAYVADLPLMLRASKLTKEWTWCPSKKGFGLFPQPAGDAAVPVQERLNDCISKIDEYMDRLACGILLANEQYINTKAMNNKSLLPGVLNPVAFKKNVPVSAIRDLIFEVRTAIDTAIFTYVTSLKQDMELLVGTPPQTFGAGTTQGVETMGGQQQQLNTGMIKLGLSWDLIREEHAEAAENAVMCAAKNMTDAWMNVVTDETKEFRAENVHLDQMKGSAHAESETDQGFPMTWADIKTFYENLINSADTEIVQWLMSEPANIDNALRYMAIPGLVAPGGMMRTKTLAVINRLTAPGAAPVQSVDQVSGQPVSIPSILPNKYLDDLEAAQKIIEAWSQEHWDKLEQNQPGLDNLVAYYKQCEVMKKEKAAEMQLAGGAGMPPSPNVPPQPPPGAPQA